MFNRKAGIALHNGAWNFDALAILEHSEKNNTRLDLNHSIHGTP